MPGLGRTIPALPVTDVAASVAFFCQELRFAAVHVEDGFAVLRRDEAVVHLWHADDTGWAQREGLSVQPVCSGAESFLAGTVSCRIETDDVDGLYGELAAVLHPASRNGVTETEFGTREFATRDPDGNLIEFFCWTSR